MAARAAFVHGTAVIDDDVELGDNTKVWHFVHVSSGARIGRDCSLGQNVFVGENVPLGDRVRVQNNVSIYSGVEVGDDVFLGPSCVFTNVTNPRAAVQRKDEFRRTVVGRGVSVGANATIVCGNALGEYSFVGAGAVITHDVPAFAIVVGNPAARIGWMCRCGARLAAEAVVRNAHEVTCTACGVCYTIGPDCCVATTSGA